MNVNKLVTLILNQKQRHIAQKTKLGKTPMHLFVSLDLMNIKLNRYIKMKHNLSLLFPLTVFVVFMCLYIPAWMVCAALESFNIKITRINYEQ